MCGDFTSKCIRHFLNKCRYFSSHAVYSVLAITVPLVRLAVSPLATSNHPCGFHICHCSRWTGSALLPGHSFSVLSNTNLSFVMKLGRCGTLPGHLRGLIYFRMVQGFDVVKLMFAANDLWRKDWLFIGYLWGYRLHPTGFSARKR